jgi:hypothetical protein
MGVNDLLVLIPAHNEAASLPSVLAEVRALVPGADILVVDDGSSDGTFRLVDRRASACCASTSRSASEARCAWSALRGPARLFGGPCGRRRQHRPSDIDALMTPIARGG